MPETMSFRAIFGFRFRPFVRVYLIVGFVVFGLLGLLNLLIPWMAL